MRIIRKVPAVEERVETGAVRFGDDWPGLFVRGDDCPNLMFLLNLVKEEGLIDGFNEHFVDRLLDDIYSVTGQQRD